MKTSENNQYIGVKFFNHQKRRSQWKEKPFQIVLICIVTASNK